METAQTALKHLTVMPWYVDWAWGLPEIALTMVIHAIGLLLISEWVDRLQNAIVKRCGYPLMFVVVTGGAAILAAALHGIEGVIWAVVYRLVGAVPDYPQAVLYSLGAMTTYGHATLVLQPGWQFLGALEALNGMLLFGLTTAFLFVIIQKTQELQKRTRR